MKMNPPSVREVNQGWCVVHAAEQRIELLYTHTFRFFLKSFPRYFRAVEIHTFEEGPLFKTAKGDKRG